MLDEIIVRWGPSGPVLQHPDNLCVSFPLRVYRRPRLSLSISLPCLPFRSQVFSSPSSAPSHSLSLHMPVLSCSRQRRRRRTKGIKISLSPAAKPLLNPNEISNRQICLHSAHAYQPHIPSDIYSVPKFTHLFLSIKAVLV